MYFLVEDIEIIDKLNISPSTLNRYIKDGLPVYELPKHRRVIDLLEAEMWLKKSRSKKRQALGNEIEKFGVLRARILMQRRCDITCPMLRNIK